MASTTIDSSDPETSMTAIDKALTTFLAVIKNALSISRFSEDDLIPCLFVMEADDEDEMDILEILYLMSARGRHDDDVSTNCTWYDDSKYDLVNNSAICNFMANFELKAIRSFASFGRISSIVVSLPPMSREGYVYKKNGDKRRNKSTEFSENFIELIHAAARVRENVHDDDLRLFSTLFENPEEDDVFFVKENISTLDETKKQQNYDLSKSLSPTEELDGLLPSYVGRIRSNMKVTPSTHAAAETKTNIWVEDEDSLFSNSYGETESTTDVCAVHKAKIGSAREQEQTETSTLASSLPFGNNFATSLLSYMTGILSPRGHT